MTVSKLVIFCSSGHAKVIIDIIESNSQFEFVGLIDNQIPKGQKLLGYEILGNDASLPELMQEYDFHNGIIGIGDNIIRSKVAKSIKAIAPQFKFVNCIHSSAVISKHCQFGVGNVVMPGTVINAASVLSDHCIINTNASLDHDCTMENFSSLAPNVAIGGNCFIGEFSNIGIGTSVFQEVSIGKNGIIGGGSVVNKDVKENSKYFGIPAKFVSNNEMTVSE